ncbi:LolA family protein [Winogradskyella ursingii]|uniref:LolA family protein n=1 Tax=Winogradskyella ursingii TaxID=2686079 RepID=UPI0015C9BB20|nr:outer membrane lipoprotein carrier protein LolA [Winogradskyella ursingii]
MKINRLLLAITLLFCASFFGNAQTELDNNQQKALKAKVIENANKTESILSDFIQEKYLSIMENPIVSKGKLVFKAPNLVKWEYIIPYKNVVIFKNDKLYVNNEGKTDEMDLSSNKIFRSLNTLIVNSIKGDMFDNSQFEISYFKNDAGYLVKFIPKDRRLKKFISRFELHFSEVTVDVEQVKLIEPNDDYTLILFSNKHLNVSISDEAFKL